MIPTPPYSQNAAEGEAIQKAVSAGKLLSYTPSEGWAYRSREEINAASDVYDPMSDMNPHWPVFTGQLSTAHETV